MKKTVLCVILVLLGVFAFGQQFEAMSTHYNVLSEVDQAHADDTLKLLESALVAFNNYFRFDLAELANPMTVRIFQDSSSAKASPSSFFRPGSMSVRG